MTNALRQTGALAGLLLAIGFSLLLTCKANGQQAPSTPADPAKSTPAGSAPTNNVRPAIKWKRFDYTCEGGDKITVYVHNSTAKIRTHDKIYLMRQTPSADGNRYSDGKVLWWGKGDGGFLQEDTPDGDGKMLVKGCVLDKPTDAPKP